MKPSYKCIFRKTFLETKITTKFDNQWGSHENFLYLQRVLKGVVQLTESSLVATSVTVIGCTEDGNHILIMRPVVTLQSTNSSMFCTAMCSKVTTYLLHQSIHNYRPTSQLFLYMLHSIVINEVFKSI